MLDPDVRDDALAAALPEALAAHMNAADPVLSARALEALSRILEGPRDAAMRVVALGGVKRLIRPLRELADGTGAMSPLVHLALRGLLAATRSGVGGELRASGVTPALLDAVPLDAGGATTVLAQTVNEIRAAL
eukprot:TRINITY_DN9060_c0_g1_i1.p2 TRINITY_DN9060_c0_g1~~TRINITY_DN9060_c0_g1_i1.p2  ORF type:complete len:134 (-),score=96.41 TRINITY_DN9060_c0_g1_i1:55-456(-)